MKWKRDRAPDTEEDNKEEGVKLWGEKRFPRQHERLVAAY
jgi:hypothetical protein